jgi:hypothetical protein
MGHDSREIISNMNDFEPSCQIKGMKCHWDLQMNAKLTKFW